jgi:LEA14-like dessication related protein
MSNRLPLFAVLCLAACKTLEVKPDLPGLTVGEASQLTALSQSLTEFTLKLDGTLVGSTEDALVQSASVELVVEGAVVKKSTVPLNLPVPAGATVPFALEQSSQYVKTADELKAMDARGGSLLSAVRGEFTVSLGGKTIQVPYARSREVRVPRLPHMKFQDVEAGRYSDEEAGATFHFGVQNPNPFQVTVSAITYTLDVAGKRIAEATTVGKGERVSPASTGVFDVEAKVSSESHGADIKKLIKSRALPYVITGTLTSELFSEPFEFKGTITLPAAK